MSTLTHNLADHLKTVISMLETRGDLSEAEAEEMKAAGGVLNTLEQSTPDNAAELVEKARDRYAMSSSDDVEVDDDAIFSPADDGTWVSAWVWIADND